MTALCIVGGIVLLFVLIGLIPAGVEAAYNENGFALYVRASFLRIALGGGAEKPKKEKPNKKEKKATEPEETPSAEKKKPKLPPWPVLKLLAKRGFELLSRLLRRFRFRLLRLHFTAAFPDPSDTAMAYAAAGTAMDTLLHIGGGRIEKADLRADVDFDSHTPLIDFRASLTIRIGAVVGQALRFGICVLRDYLKYRKDERIMEHGSESHR